MSLPVAPGRIRWALPGLALALAILASMLPAGSALASSVRVEVIVQMDAGSSPASAIAQVRRSGGRVTGRLPIINGFAARVTPAAERRLAAAAGVHAVTRNAKTKPQGVSLSRIQTAYPASVDAPQLWNYDTSVTGKGVGVAVIDTGIAGQMPDFRSPGSILLARHRHRGHQPRRPHAGRRLRPRHARRGHHRRQRLGPLDLRPAARQVRRHRARRQPDLGQGLRRHRRRHRPRRDLRPAVRGRQQGRVQHPRRQPVARVERAQSYKTDPLDAAVESAWFKGIVVVAAAGNRGSTANAVSYAPGNDPYVITVGASTTRRPTPTATTAVRRGRAAASPQDGFAKPEIHAPGAHIVSTLAPGSQFTAMCPTCIVDGQIHPRRRHLDGRPDDLGHRRAAAPVLPAAQRPTRSRAC